MNKRLLFVHIPKTAGTSFRLAAKKQFGDEHTFFDYSPKSVETSKDIVEYVYKQKDMYALSEVFSKHKEIFLSGHFGVGKYMSLFETLNVITFVRNPIEQVLSHYKHYKSHHGYTETLTHFIKEERFKNIQFKILKEKPLELYGFIGLTEEYEKSIELINDYYGLDFEILKANIGIDRDDLTAEIDQDVIDLIKKENLEDIEIYEKAKAIFYERIKCFENNKRYAHLLIQEKTDKIIRGCAFTKSSSKPLDIEIHFSDKIVPLKAKSFRPGLLSQGIQRKGFVGFEYRFENMEEYKSFLYFKSKSNDYIVRYQDGDKE